MTREESAMKAVSTSYHFLLVKGRKISITSFSSSSLYMKYIKDDPIYIELNKDYLNSKANEMKESGKIGIGTKLRYKILRAYIKKVRRIVVGVENHP